MNPSAKQASTKSAHFIFLEGVQKLFSWEVSCDMFVNFISVENLSKWPAYLWHVGGKRTIWLKSRRPIVS